MREVNMNPGASSPCVFLRNDVDGSGLVHCDDFVMVTCRWHAKEIEKHLRGPETRSDVGPEESGKQGSASQHSRGRHERLCERIRVERARRDQVVPSRGSERQLLEHGQARSAIQCKGFFASHVKTNEEGSAEKRKTGDILEVACFSASQVCGVGHQPHSVHRLRPGRNNRRSTPGGVVSTNVGVVKHLSSTQRPRVLSSCEAELYAMNKEAAEAMGIWSLAPDTGITFDLLLRTDASAALGVVNKHRVGKTRHMDTQEQCLQNAIRNQELEVQKVAGEENVADILLKGVKSEVLEKPMASPRQREMDDDGCT